MAVTSGTLAGVNTWTFSGVVTDAQIQTAWAALVANGVYTINRAIYLDNTADLSTLTGGFLINFGTQVSPAFILHTLRDKTKSTFKNFTFIQSTGLSVGARSNFVNTWNGTTLSTPVGADGVSQSGGGMVYGVAGNPGGGDPRFLNEMSFAGLDGVTIFSQEYTEQELQIVISQTSTLKGITFEKCFGFPQIGATATTGNVNIVVYRSTQNTQNLTQYPLRLYPSGGAYSAVCYVDSYVTRNNADITTRLADFFGANATSRAVVVILNNYTRESWFGATKTNFSAMGNWNAANQIWGGVLKKLQFVGGGNGVVKCYDSRSTTTSQKSKFLESGSVDFLDASIAPTTDSEGRISLVHIGALSTGGTSNSPITRYTGQIYTFQKFGYRVLVGTPTMTSGDNDLSAFTPIVLSEQAGISRPLATINSATEINNFQELLEELHVLAIGLSGSQSYNGAFNGNLFNYDGSVLTTSFTTVNLDATAASKIAYNANTNTLTIKSSVLIDSLDVQRWNNPAGTINLLNGATIQGVYQTSAGTSTIWEFGATGEPVLAGTSLAIYDNAGVTKYFNAVTTDGVYRYYIAPQAVGETFTYAIEKYGDRREQGTFMSNNGGIIGYVPAYSEDVGITETTLATVQAYTTLSDTAEIYDATANFRLSETGIKLGQLVARDGTFLDFGTFNVLFKDDNASIVSVASGTITYKALVINESTKYNAMKATPPKTILANDTEQINVLIEDANGDSQLTVLGGDNLGYELWKIPTSTATDDYATGTLLDTLSTNAEVFRFIGISGFDIVGRDISSGVRRRSSMAKGSYEQAFYVGNQIQLATDAPQLIENNEKLDELILKIDTNLDEKISTRLAEIDYVAPHNAEIDAIKAVTDTLTNYDDTILQGKVDSIQSTVDALENTDLTGIATTQNVTDAKDEIIAELANIDVDLTGVALEATSQDIITKVDAIQATVDNIDVDFTPVLNAVDALPTLTEIEASTVLANKTDVETAKDEIIAEVQNIDVDLTGIATTNDVVNAANGLYTEIQSVDENVWANQPERLKNVATVESTGDQIQAFKS